MSDYATQRDARADATLANIDAAVDDYVYWAGSGDAMVWTPDSEPDSDPLPPIQRHYMGDWAPPIDTDYLETAGRQAQAAVSLWMSSVTDPAAPTVAELSGGTEFTGISNIDSYVDRDLDPTGGDMQAFIPRIACGWPPSDGIRSWTRDAAAFAGLQSDRHGHAVLNDAIQMAMREHAASESRRLLLEMVTGNHISSAISEADSRGITYDQMTDLVIRGEWRPPVEPAPTPQEIRARALELRRNRNTGPAERRRPPRNIEPRGNR